jgi:hypothetical protein
LKKRTKKLLRARSKPVFTGQLASGVSEGAKVFCFFFSKKKYCLSSFGLALFAPV